MDSTVKDFGNNIIALSPKFSDLRESLVTFIEANGINDHVVFLSSGTTSTNPKGYVISKEAMFSNAKAVNDHLGLGREDRWGVTLPPFHVGGLSVYFRSSLLNHTPTLLFPWSPETLSQKITENKVTIISLVPTQIFDLVKLGIKAPKNLKYVLAGGDFLSMGLEEKALDLGWPLLRTFGMSEVASQIATATQVGSRDLKILPLHQLKTDEEKKLWIKTPSLFSFEINYQNGWKLNPSSNFKDKNGHYLLPDKGNIHGDHLIPLGRHDGKFKSSGLLIDYFDLKERLETLMLKNECWGKIDLSIKVEERKGQILCLEYENSVNFEIIEEFKKLIQPIKIDELLPVQSIQRNELGKKMIQNMFPRKN
jgi:O-succinylbenzoic acid--CoA ligase